MKSSTSVLASLIKPKQFIFYVFIGIVFCIVTAFINPRPGKNPPRKVVFFSQRLTKSSIESFLLVPNANYYIFQPAVKGDNNNREKYDLVVYIYDNLHNVLNYGNTDLLIRSTSAPNNQKYEPEEKVNISAYGMTKARLQEMLSAHPSATYLTFRPYRSQVFPNHVDYVVHPSDVVLPATSTVDSITRKQINGKEKVYYYHQFEKLKPFIDTYDLNPSPPRNMAQEIDM